MERIITVHTMGTLRALKANDQSDTMKSTTPCDNRRQHDCEAEEPIEVPVCVICSLVENSYLYITVDGVETQLHAEALVHISSLFLSDTECVEDNAQNSFPLDEGAQELLAVDIIESVSLLKNAKNDFQVILPWRSTGNSSSTAHSRRMSTLSMHGMDMTSVMNALDMNDDESLPPDELGQTCETNEREQDDLEEYFTPITISCGVKATLSCGLEPDDVNTRMKLRQKKVTPGAQEFIPEEIYMLVQVTRVGEEKARVVVHTLRDSVNMYSKQPALPANSRLELMIALPSVLTVESDLMEDYFKNAAVNIRVEHSQETGVNYLILD